MEIQQASDQELVELVKKDADNDAMKELVTRHSGIYINMVKSYGGKSFNQNQLSDFINQKDTVIYEAAQQYNPEKSKFSTFLANKTKFLCLSEKTKFQKNTREVRFDDIDFCQKDSSLNPEEYCIEHETMEKILEMIMSYEDERVGKIFHLRYFCGKGKKMLPWKEVAEKLELSAQSCINIHDRTLELFKNRIKNEQTIKF